MCSATTNTQTYMLYTIIYDFDREKLSKCCISSLDSLSKSKNHHYPILTQGENKSFQNSVMPYQVFRFAI